MQVLDKNFNLCYLYIKLFLNLIQEQKKSITTRRPLYTSGSDALSF